MQSRIKMALPMTSGLLVTDVFGYCSRGLAGIEILGLGQRGRTLKEKLVFLTRSRGVKLPGRKYLLCVPESWERRDCRPDAEWADLAFLILLWSLGEVLPIRNLHSCLTMGKASVEGVVTLPHPETWQGPLFDSSFNQQSIEQFAIIGQSATEAMPDCPMLPVQQLLGEHSALSFHESGKKFSFCPRSHAI